MIMKKQSNFGIQLFGFVSWVQKLKNLIDVIFSIFGGI